MVFFDTFFMTQKSTKHYEFFLLQKICFCRFMEPWALQDDADYGCQVLTYPDTIFPIVKGVLQPAGDTILGTQTGMLLGEVNVRLGAMTRSQISDRDSLHALSLCSFVVASDTPTVYVSSLQTENHPSIGNAVDVRSLPALHGSMTKPFA